MRQISDLLARLTLEEKASLCAGADSWHTQSVPRLGIPAMMVSDGPHGLRTEVPGSKNSVEAVCWPAGCAAAASFDTGLVFAEGQALGQECRAEGVGVLLGPAINIKRSPLCGRNFEYYSEDPCLAGALSAALVAGVQSQGVGACPKHFAANNQETRRMSCSSEPDERTLREIYLPAFEQTVKTAAPWTMMCSYNRLNGVYASENARLLTDILRTEWGFSGFVMSDWGAVNDRVRGLPAGLDLEMPGPSAENTAAIVAAVQNGTLAQSALDEAVTRILNIVLRWADLDAAAPRPVFDRAADHKKAAAMAADCAVLVKNKGVLPLYAGQRVAYIGGFAAQPRYQGGGSSHINTAMVDSALSAAEQKGRRVEFCKGFPVDFDERNESDFLAAVETARVSDAAVVFAGLPESFESEGYDRRHMRLPDSQNNLIARVAAVQKNTIVVLHTGSPVECPWADDVAAVLCMYLGGEGVGAATDAVLYGEVNPSGRLPETWPLRLEDTPCYLDFPGDGRTAQYREGPFVGYRYYDARKMPVRWPFGHGLSYTGFVYRHAALSATEMDEQGSVEVSVSIRNSGSVAGKEVVQLYVTPPNFREDKRPPKELRHFVKLELQPGEEKTARFTVTARELSYYNTALGRFYAAPGNYKLLLGHSSRDIHATLSLHYSAAPLPLPPITGQTVLGELLADPRTAGPMQELARSIGRNAGGIAGAGITQETALQMAQDMPLRALARFAHIENQLPALLHALRAAAGQED